MDRVSVNDETRAWRVTALAAGLVAAAALFTQNLLFLLDATGLQAEYPVLTETGAGRDVDLANFYVAYFERQHDIAWNIAVRDTLGPIAALAMIVLVWALVRLRAPGSAGLTVAAIVLTSAAVLKLMSDLVYLSQLGVWRLSGFIATPPADINAVGRLLESITYLADYLEYASSVLFAIGLVGITPWLTRRLRILAWLLALGLIVGVVTSLLPAGETNLVVGIATGFALSPAMLISLGYWLRSRDQPTVGATD